MTVPQALALQTHLADVDGHREVAQTLIDIARALAGVKDDTPPPATPAAVPDSNLLIPELQAIVDQQVAARLAISQPCPST